MAVLAAAATAAEDQVEAVMVAAMAVAVLEVVRVEVVSAAVMEAVTEVMKAATAEEVPWAVTWVLVLVV